MDVNSFAYKQLEKFGWKQGKGLGKKEDGISEQIKATKREKDVGIGAEKTDWTDHWWDRAYNKAASKRSKKRRASSSDSEDDASSSGSSVPNSRYGNSFTVSGGQSKLEKEKQKFASQHSYDEVFQLCAGRRAKSHHPEGKLQRVLAQELAFSQGSKLAEATSAVTDTENSARKKRQQEVVNGDTATKSKRVKSGDKASEEKKKKKQKRQEKEKEKKEKQKQRKKSKLNSREDNSTEEVIVAAKKEKKEKKKSSKKKQK